MTAGTSAGDESYGLLTNDWRPRWHDERLRQLRRCAPHQGAPQRLGHAPSLDGLSNHGNRCNSDSAGSTSSSSSGTSSNGSSQNDTSWLNAAVATALTHACLIAPPPDWPVNMPLVWAPSPWCGPLPGPLIPWPGDPVLPAHTIQGGDNEELSGGVGSRSANNTSKKTLLPRKRSTSSYSSSSSSAAATMANSRRSSAPIPPSSKKGSPSSTATMPRGSSNHSKSISGSTSSGKSALDSSWSLLSPPAAALASALLRPSDHPGGASSSSRVDGAFGGGVSGGESGLLNDMVGMEFLFGGRPGDGLWLPQPRYLWTVTQGIDADPGLNADEVISTKIHRTRLLFVCFSIKRDGEKGRLR